jgi:hypothetical protein
LYPRKRKFSLKKSIDEKTILATSNDELWKISRAKDASNGEERFDFEKISLVQSDDSGERLEYFKRCFVTKVGDEYDLPRRSSLVDNR